MSLFITTTTTPRRRRAASLLRTALCVGIAVLATAGATLTLSGCGSSGGTETLGSSNPSRKKGSATFTVTWPVPDPSRKIPAASNSIKITLLKGTTVLGTRVLARPAVGQPQTVSTSFTSLESGTDYSAIAEAFPSNDGSGVAQASKQVGFAVQDNVNTPVKLTMDLTIKNLIITPTITSPLGSGAQRRLFVSGTDANGSIVVTTLGTVSVTSSNPSLVSVTPDPSTPDPTDFLVDVLQSVNSSTPVTITATDSESGLSTSITLTIVPVGLSDDAAWPKFRGDLYNSGDSFINGPSVTPSFGAIFATGDSIQLSSPVIDKDGVVYIGSWDGTIYAYNSNTQSMKWTVSTGGPIESSAAIAKDGSIYIGSGDGKLYCVQPDGSVRFAFDAGAGAINGAPTLGPDGTVYFGTVNGANSAIVAIDGLSGQEMWRYTGAGDDIRTSPAVVANSLSDVTVYFASVNGKLIALSGKADANGNPVVKATATVADVGNTGTFFTSSPTIDPIDPSTVYIGAQDNHLYAFDSSSLSQKWAFDAGAPIYSSPLIATDGTGRIFVATFDTFSGDTKSKLWAVMPDGTADVGGFGAFDPATGFRTGYFTPEELDPNDPTGQTTIGTLITSSPVMGGDGMIYFGAYNDRVYAVSPTDGSLPVWDVKLSPGTLDDVQFDIDSSPAIGPNGDLFVGCVDGNVYQFTGGGPRNGRAASVAGKRITGRGHSPGQVAGHYRLPNFRLRGR